MRLDKFLKVSRLIKRRTVAKEVADQGRIKINDKDAKAGSEVKVGDILTVRFGNRTIKASVDKIVETSKKEDAAEMFTILEQDGVDELE